MIEPIIAMMDADKTIGACQPKVLSYHNKDRFEYAGAGGGFIDHLGYPFVVAGSSMILKLTLINMMTVSLFSGLQEHVCLSGPTFITNLGA